MKNIRGKRSAALSLLQKESRPVGTPRPGALVNGRPRTRAHGHFRQYSRAGNTLATFSPLRGRRSAYHL
jgi:hypothetical protein